MARLCRLQPFFGNDTFQIRPKDKTNYSATYSLPLAPGSIVLLSGDFSWQ